MSVINQPYALLRVVNIVGFCLNCTLITMLLAQSVGIFSVNNKILVIPANLWMIASGLKLKPMK